MAQVPPVSMDNFGLKNTADLLNHQLKKERSLTMRLSITIRILVFTCVILSAGILSISSAAENPLTKQDDCASEKLKQASQEIQIGCKALDDFMTAFNSGDALSWAKTLNYPHVRLAGEKVRVWDTPEAYAKENDTKQLAEKEGWGYTKWDWRWLVQTSREKQHWAVQFTRYTPDGKPIKSSESFYIITNVEGHWGTQARSSFVGITIPGAAY